MAIITVELDDAEELGAQLWSDARRAMRKARRAGAVYVAGEDAYAGYQLRIERVVDAYGVWLCPDADAEAAAEYVEQLLGWWRQVLEALSRSDGAAGARARATLADGRSVAGDQCG